MFSDRREGALSWQRVGRALYLPQELMGFAEGSGLLWLAGKRTACASSPCPIGKPSDAQAAPRAIPIMTVDPANCLHTKVVKPDLE